MPQGSFFRCRGLGSKRPDGPNVRVQNEIGGIQRASACDGRRSEPPANYWPSIFGHFGGGKVLVKWSGGGRQGGTRRRQAGPSYEPSLLLHTHNLAREPVVGSKLPPTGS
jgi:hypothetical protein